MSANVSSINKMNICVVIPVLNQFELLRENLKLLTQDGSSHFEILILDGNSDEEFSTDIPNVNVVKLNKTVGPYEAFWLALGQTNADIMAYFHTDMLVYDSSWYRQVATIF